MSETTEATRPRRRTQAERRAETRASVLAAARSVFGRRGLRGASLEEIAEEAGVSRGAVYYNFDDKEHLFLTLLRERCAVRAERLRHARAASDDPGTEIRRIATRFIEDAEEDAEWTRLFAEFSALVAERPELRAEAAHELAACRDAIAEILERRLRDLGITSEVPTDQLAAVTGALANGLALERLVEPTLPRDLLARTIELIIAGVGAAERPRGG
jgi:AcrR family transcriptional regulator